jgi:hypothetical protein
LNGLSSADAFATDVADPPNEFTGRQASHFEIHLHGLKIKPENRANSMG